jgi:hypothetical protein
VKSLVTLAALLALGGCDRSHEAHNGRFQMLLSGDEQHDVYLLDTTNGDIWICQGDARSVPTVKCGIPEKPKE